ncbi:MAG: hypothetical protein KA967_04305 [Methanoculleus sp.]|nr:hypothetical protein [Methanoculleus sp.]
MKTTTRTRTPTGTFKAERTPGEALTREELARMTSDVLKKLHARAAGDRFYPRESDQALMAIIRAFVAGVSALNSVLRDGEIGELERRLTALEEQRHENS